MDSAPKKPYWQSDILIIHKLLMSKNPAERITYTHGVVSRNHLSPHISSVSATRFPGKRVYFFLKNITKTICKDRMCDIILRPVKHVWRVYKPYKLTRKRFFAHSLKILRYRPYTFMCFRRYPFTRKSFSTEIL